MWKARPEDNKPMSTNPSQPAAQPAPQQTAAVAAPTVTTAAPAPAPTPAPHKETPKANDSYKHDVGHIGKSVHIRGELTGSEDLYLDGEVEGNIDLRDHSLIIGPNGKIKAGIVARDLVVHGKVEGNITASGRVELRKSCTLIGDVSTQRIVIEDGAFFKGAIDIKEKDFKQESRKPVVAAAAAGGMSTGGMSSGSSNISNPSPTSSTGVASYSASSAAQGSFLDGK